MRIYRPGVDLSELFKLWVDLSKQQSLFDRHSSKPTLFLPNFSALPQQLATHLSPSPHTRLRSFHEILMPSNEHHKWLKKRDWPAVQGVLLDPDSDLDLLMRKYKERDEHGRLPHHWMAAKAQTHTHTLAEVGVESIRLNPEALATRDNKGETPLDIASRSGACDAIIGLLSLTQEGEPKRPSSTSDCSDSSQELSNFDVVSDERYVESDFLDDEVPTSHLSANILHVHAKLSEPPGPGRGDPDPTRTPPPREVLDADMLVASWDGVCCVLQ